jgi:hypothetical protein
VTADATQEGHRMPHRYEVHVAGRLSDRARNAFPAIDEAGLHGLLELCRNLGLEVTSFNRVEL